MGPREGVAGSALATDGSSVWLASEEDAQPPAVVEAPQGAAMAEYWQYYLRLLDRRKSLGHRFLQARFLTQHRPLYREA